MSTPHTRIGLVLFPRLTQLDLTGPVEVFGRMPEVEIVLLWKTLYPVPSDRGMCILPTATFEDCDSLDVICVPGGPGQVELMEDEDTLQFLRRIAPTCKFVTSVCTGSLVLGAAGLLNGYRATSHWSSVDQLSLLGADPVSERVVRDRNRITGAGVTSGIDFALAVVAELAGADVAQEIQLQMEYDPEPPYQAGSPRSAPPALVTTTREKLASFIERRRAVTERAAKRLANVQPT
ncbi:class I glutamine amidotransferase-like protein [Lipomyces doorenjongii]|uniref:class I glutamine amidotransferase-like protein n=1 Tax=Lipomyces doorenjongii TaxID=383834 RepID=UPI0034CEAE72